MEIWSIIFYITSLASIIIPTIFCYKKFYKAEVGSCSRGASIFFYINFLPSFGGSGGVIIDSFNTYLDYWNYYWNRIGNIELGVFKK